MEDLYTEEENLFEPVEQETLKGPVSQNLDSITQANAAKREERLSKDSSFKFNEQLLGSDLGQESIKQQGLKNQKDVIEGATLETIEYGDTPMVKELLEQRVQFSIDKSAVQEARYQEALHSSENSIKQQAANEELVDYFEKEKATTLLLNRQMQFWQDKIDGQHWVKDVRNFGIDMIGFATTSNINSILNAGWNLSGDTLLEAHQKFVNLPTVEEREAMLNSLGVMFKENSLYEDPVLMQQIIAAVAGGVTDERQWEQNFFDYADIVNAGLVTASTVIPLLLPLAGGVTALRSLRAGHGAAKVAKRMEDSVVKVSDPDTMDALSDAVNASLNSSVKEQPNSTFPIVKDLKLIDLDDKFEAKAGDEAKGVMTARTVSDEEVTTNISNMVSKYIKQTPAQVRINGDVLDVAMDFTAEVSNFTGSGTVTKRIGVVTDKGQISSETVTEAAEGVVVARQGTGVSGLEGFHNKIEGEVAARQMNIKNYEVVEQDGMWYVESYHSVPNKYKDSWVVGQADRIRTGGLLGINFLSGLAGADVKMPLSLSKWTHLAGDSRAQVDRYFNNVTSRMILKDSEARENLWNAVSRGQNPGEGKKSYWLSEEELRRDFNLDDKGVDAYKAYREIEDTEHWSANALKWSTKNDKGYKTVSLKTPLKGESQFDAIPMEDLAKVDLELYDVNKGETIKFNTHEQKTLALTGRRVMRLEDSKDGFSGHRVRYVVGDKASVEIRPLTTKQLQYLAGGRRRYQGSYFIGQGRVDLDKGMIRTGRAIGVAKTAEEAEEFVSVFNDLRVIYKDMKDGKITREQADVAMRKAGKGKTNVTTVDSFEKMVQSKNGDYKIDINKPFEFRTDKGRFKSEKDARALKDEAGEYVIKRDVESDTHLDYMNKVVYGHGDQWSARGEILMDMKGDAPTMSPYESVQRSLRTLKDNLTVRQYRERTMNETVEEFSDVMQSVESRGVYESFFNPKFINNPTPLEQESIIKAKQIIATTKTFLNVETDGEKWVRERLWSIGNKLGGEELATSFGNLRPNHKFKAINFHTKLGGFVFGLKDLLTQSTGLVNVAGLSGLDAPKVMGKSVFVGMLLKVSPDNAGSIYKSAKAFGIDVDDLKESVREIRMLNKTSLSTFADATLGEDVIRTGALHTAKNLNTMFFQMGEKGVKLTSFIAAREKWIKAKGRKPKTNTEFAEVSAMADQFAGGMVDASKSVAQNGWVGLATQFQHYRFKLLESILPEALGGVSSELITPKQKLGLFLTMAGAWGSKGLISDEIGEEMVEGWEPSSDAGVFFKHAVKEGVIETSYASLTGNRLDLGGRMSPQLMGRAFSDFVNGHPTDWEALMMPPSGAMVKNLYNGTWGALHNFVDNMKADVSTPETMSLFLNDVLSPLLKENPSLNRGLKLMMAKNVSETYDTWGNLVKDDWSAHDLMWEAFAVKPQEISDAYLFKKMYSPEQAVEAGRKDHAAWFREWEKGDITTDQYFDRIKVFSLLPPEVGGRILSYIPSAFSGKQRMIDTLIKNGYMGEVQQYLNEVDIIEGNK